MIPGQRLQDAQRPSMTGLILAGRAMRRRRLQQHVAAGDWHNAAVLNSTVVTWQEAEGRLAVLCWWLAHWGMPWPEVYEEMRMESSAFERSMRRLEE
jgi:hypothetical protein